MMVLPPPETSSTAVQSPEAFVAMVTLFVIAFAVYGLSKIRLSSLRWIMRIFFDAREARITPTQTAQDHLIRGE